jgi:hypothetical protein
VPVPRSEVSPVGAVVRTAATASSVSWPSWGVPAGAVSEWVALQLALRELEGPTPCQEDPEVWFSRDARDVEAAVDSCLDCPLFLVCGAYATAADEGHGVWGGMSFSTRRRSSKEGDRA